MVPLLLCWLLPAPAAEAPGEQGAASGPGAAMQAVPPDRPGGTAGAEPVAAPGQDPGAVAEDAGGVPDSAVEPGGRRANIGLCDGS
jgi:hypothetical protein